MKRFSLYTIAIGLFAMTGSAFAADMPLLTKAPPPPVWSWTGFYVGGNVGYSWASNSTTMTNTTTTSLTRIDDADTPNPIFTPLGTTVGPAATGSGNLGLPGWLGGIQGGYNWQINSLVLGLEGDIQANGESGSTTLCDTAGCPIGSGIGTETLKMPWFGTLRVRVGYTPAARWLVYATGGLAVAEIKDSLTEGPVGGGAGGTSINLDTTRAGYAVGGGVETAITDHWSLKLEYLYMNFGTVSGTGTGSPATTTTGNCAFCAPPRILESITTQTTTGISTRVSDNIVRVGVNYRFGP